MFGPLSSSDVLYLQTLSLFPPRILKLLEFAGFSGDKVGLYLNLNLLHYVFAHKLTQEITHGCFAVLGIWSVSAARWRYRDESALHAVCLATALLLHLSHIHTR